MIITFGILFIFISAAYGASMYYVYNYRGNARYETLNQYFRKAWPIFAPLNCFLYLFTNKKANKPIIDVKDFPELKTITDSWEVIKEEGQRLFNNGNFDLTNNPNSDAYYDIGFRSFYKYGWSKFYLKWYGHTHKSALELCPRTSEIISKIPSVSGAMFSVITPQSELTRHIDPIASSLRYHLGLNTPNSNDCFINVDGQTYSWRDGEAFMFDETYLHFVKNNTDSHRLILMCDINRPTSFFGSLLNIPLKFIMGVVSLVPNLPGDQRGIANIIFSTITPFLKSLKQLKEANRPLYILVKNSINIFFVLLSISILAGIVFLIFKLTPGLN
jgi:beta-hydroxylase